MSEFVTVKEAAARLRISASTVRDLCDQRKLLAIRPSGNPQGRRVIVAKSVDDYIASLIEAEQPEHEVRFIPPPRVVFDDSERELARLIRIGKSGKKARP